MKSIIVAMLASTSLSTAAFADSFDNTQLSFIGQVGVFDVELEAATDGGVNSARADGEVIVYSMTENTYSNIDLFAEYSVEDELLTAGAEYTATYMIESVSMYGSAELGYVASTDDLSSGNLQFVPTVGMTYTVADLVSVFGEVSYVWNDTWVEGSATAEVGASYFVSNDWFVTPSLVRNLDGDADDQVKITTGFVF